MALGRDVVCDRLEDRVVDVWPVERVARDVGAGVEVCFPTVEALDVCPAEAEMAAAAPMVGAIMAKQMTSAIREWTSMTSSWILLGVYRKPRAGGLFGGVGPGRSRFSRRKALQGGDQSMDWRVRVVRPLRGVPFEDTRVPCGGQSVVARVGVV